MTRGRARLVTTIAGTVLALGGTTLIVIAVASQEHPAEPPISSAGPVEPVPAEEVGPPSAVVTDASGPRPGAGLAPPASLPPSDPITIDIPAIGVHSLLVRLGLSPAGVVQVPSGDTYDEAGWYRYSPPPGSVGPAVILGHVDSAASGPSVFFRLGELRPGDRVTVGRRDGSIAVFEITGVRRYPKDEFPTELVYGNTDGAELRLITCGGSFDFSTGHYMDNVVVFADLAGSR